VRPHEISFGRFFSFEAFLFISQTPPLHPPLALLLLSGSCCGSFDIPAWLANNGTHIDTYAECFLAALSRALENTAGLALCRAVARTQRREVDHTATDLQIVVSVTQKSPLPRRIGVDSGGAVGTGLISPPLWTSEQSRSPTDTQQSPFSSCDYGSQGNIADAIRASGIPRNHLWITSKINVESCGDIDTVTKAVQDQVLTPLQTNYVGELRRHDSWYFSP
jgi:hypothetical protein